MGYHKRQDCLQPPCEAAIERIAGGHYRCGAHTMWVRALLLRSAGVIWSVKRCRLPFSVLYQQHSSARRIDTRVLSAKRQVDADSSFVASEPGLLILIVPYIENKVLLIDRTCTESYFT